MASVCGGWVALLITLGNLSQPDAAPEGYCESSANKLVLAVEQHAISFDDDRFGWHPDRAVLKPAPAGQPAGRTTHLALSSAAGQPRRLDLRPRWQIVHGTEVTPIPIPKNAKKVSEFSIIGSSGEIAWLAGDGQVAALSVSPTAPPTAVVWRLVTGRQRPHPLAVGDSLWLHIDGKIVGCEPSGGCKSHGDLAGTIGPMVRVDDTWLLATTGQNGGLYRWSARAPGDAHPVAMGEVLALCRGRESVAWAWLRGTEGWRAVAISQRTPAVRTLTFEQVLIQGLLAAPQLPAANLVVGALNAASRHGFTDGAALAFRARLDPRPAVRAAAARVLGGAQDYRAVAAIWLLAKDAKEEVRRATLEGIEGRCKAGPARICVGLLSLLVEDASQEIAWAARDSLLPYDVAAAMRAADSTYKLDVLPRLTVERERGDRGAEQALRMLVDDSNAEVRSLARTIWDRATP